MNGPVLALVMSIGLAACGAAAPPTRSVAGPASDPSAPPPGAREPQGVALEAVSPCAFTAAEVSAVLGGAYGEGRPVAPIAGAPRRDCTYDAQDGGMGQLRVNITWLEPATAATSRSMMLRMLAGGTAPITGDPDGAIFQDQSELGTYALHFARGNLLYEVRLMSFQGGSSAARQTLLRLRRP